MTKKLVSPYRELVINKKLRQARMVLETRTIYYVSSIRMPKSDTIQWWYDHYNLSYMRDDRLFSGNNILSEQAAKHQLDEELVNCGYTLLSAEQYEAYLLLK